MRAPRASRLFFNNYSALAPDLLIEGRMRTKDFAVEDSPTASTRRAVAELSFIKLQFRRG